MDKYQKWWDSLPEHQKAYLNNQPVWHDKDLYKAMGVGFLIGLVIGNFSNLIR